jgi:VWA domain-containing protein/aerotolerance regulator-like protein
MTALNPLALLGLLALPLLVVFYLFRPEPRRKQSTTYFLWKAAVPESAGGTFANRLQSNPLLWLQMFILLLLLLFLCRLASPWVSQKPSANRVVLMIDRSASMKSEGAFERARDHALEAVDSLLGISLTGSSTEVMLISVDQEPQVLVPFTKDESILRQAIAEMQPTDLPDGLEDMGPFVRSLIKAHRAKIWIFGDHLPESLQVAGVQYTSAAGQTDNNVGIVSFSVQAPDPARGQDRPFAYARVENFSQAAQQRLIRVEKVERDDPEIALATLLEKTILIPAGSGETIIESIPASRFDVRGSTVFRLSVLPLPGDDPDAFETDDRAYTVVAPFRQDSILVATAPGVNAGFLIRAIAASSDVKVVDLNDYLKMSDAPAINLLIAPFGFPIPPTLEVRSLFLLAPPPEGEATVSRLDEVDQGTPLVGESGVEWIRQKVQITSFAPLEDGEVVLLSTPQEPALTLKGLTDGVPTLHWRFPLSHSSLPLSSGLPVVVGRFLDQYSRHSGVPFPGALATGTSTRRPNGILWSHELVFQLLTEGALFTKDWTVPESSTVVVPPQQTGVYSLRAGKSSDVVAVNLQSYQESRLPRQPNDLNFETAQEELKTTETRTVQYREIGLPFLLLAFLVLLLEAFVFLKRGRP